MSGALGVLVINGIDAAATLYCVFPLESSAERKKKAVRLYGLATVSEELAELTQSLRLLRLSLGVLG